jgi:hypothetical protein
MWKLELYDGRSLRASLQLDTQHQCFKEALRWTNCTHYEITHSYGRKPLREIGDDLQNYLDHKERT